MSATQVVEEVVDTSLLHDITGDVLVGMFGEDRERPQIIVATREAYEMCSVVTITGGWNGSVSFACDEAFLRIAAAELFCLAAADVTTAEIADLAGEVVNVIGGNIKSLLPGPSALSLPRTFFQSGNVRAHLLVSVDLAWCGQPMRVAVAAG